MKFLLDKYEEIGSERKNTLQVFISNKCNLNCEGCFARNIMEGEDDFISLREYRDAVVKACKMGVRQINFLGGEPLLHPQFKELIHFNKLLGLKTTVYSNGLLIDKHDPEDFKEAKLRVSFYNLEGYKGVKNFKETNISFDACFMVSSGTTINELIESAEYLEENFNCGVFFISSIRELDNPEQEFFNDTDLTMPVIEYKKLVCGFLNEYDGSMEVHISKRGVFESTKVVAENKCKFANHFIGGKIIQCPYDIVNLKYQDDYEFDKRSCQHSSTCLMSKVIYKRRK